MYEDIIALIERTKVAFPKMGTGAPEAAVTAAEKALGIPLPESYRWWLRNFGGGQIRGDIIYGLDVENIGMADIVELSRMNATDGYYNIDRLVFCVGNAENYYFDTSDLVDGEYEVFLHDTAQNDAIPYASSFSEFLTRRLSAL